MHDIKFIRDNKDAFDEAMARRGLPKQSHAILEADMQKRETLTRLQELQSHRNQLAQEIGKLKKAGENADALMEESRTVNEQIKLIEEAAVADDPIQKILESLPNILADDVPDGADETGNKLVRTEGEPTKLNFKAKDHVEIGEKLGLMDFETAAKMSGSRFVILSGALARMERALASFMLDNHTQDFGYTEIVPPLLVKDNAVYGTGQLPKFAEDLFKTTNDYWLIPTSEVPLTNIVADSIMSEAELPHRFTAYTPCFRSEAGSAGKDTRGMIRQHQFSKVEMVSIVKPEDSKAEHERMLSAAEAILKKLELPYRIMLLCSGDTGFGSQKTYDIEVWLPGQDCYREISSCSNFGDFQARRMKTRYKKEGDKQTHFPHTLNGSGLAIGRTMVAILENYQQEDGSVAIPAALQPYMGGLKSLTNVTKP